MIENFSIPTRYLQCVLAALAVAGCSEPATGAQGESSASGRTASSSGAVDSPVTNSGEIERRIAALYDDPFANDPLDPALPLTPDFNRLLAAERVAVQRNDGAPRAIESNWLVAGQDAEIADLAVTARPGELGEMIATATFRNFGEPQTVLYLWKLRTGEWRLDDIYVGGDEQSVAETLTAAHPDL